MCTMLVSQILKSTNPIPPLRLRVFAVQIPILSAPASLRIVITKIFKFPNKTTLFAVIFPFVARCNSYAHKMCNTLISPIH
jgi:hypothetical protein